jgi:beta-galactosidase
MYGSESTAGEAFEHWMSVLDMDHVIGDFVWTSLDYLGEAGIGRVYWEEKLTSFLGEYPWHQANCGDIDLCGFKRPQSYYRDVLWGSGSPLYVAVHPPNPEGKTPSCSYWGWPDVWPNWTWPGQEGHVFQVDVYSACERVELWINGRSMGAQPTTREKEFIATFEVPYEPGELKAVGYVADRPVADCEVRTVGVPAQIVLAADRDQIQARSGDLCYVTVEIVDGDEGTIAAVGSGNPVSTESYRGNQRRAFRGRCLVVVRSCGTPGEIRLRAQADGLDGAEVVIQAV